jgi:hypothetical protein
MPYDAEVMEADKKYQSEQTKENELALEKAKLTFWMKMLKENPGDAEIKEHIDYHQAEVARLEGEVKMV